MFVKVFQGEMLIKNIPTTLLHVVYENIPNSKIIVKSIKDPDDNFLRYLLKALMG